MRASILAFSVFLSLPAQAGEIPGSAFASGYWKGAAEADANGKLANCYASISYSNGESLWFYLFPDDTMTIYMADPRVVFTSGSTFAAQLMTEVNSPVSGTATAVNETFVAFTLVGNDATIDYLTQGAYLRLLGVGIDQAWDVRGLGGALAMARSCMVSNAAPATTSNASPTPPLGSSGTLGIGVGGAMPVQQSRDIKIAPPPAKPAP